MKPSRVHPLRPFAVLAAVVLAAGAWAGEPIRDIDVILEQNPGGMVKVDSPTGGFDEITLDVGKDFAAALSARALPPGWTLEAKGKTVRLTGPAAPAGTPVRFKLDPGNAPRPQKISYRASLEGRTLLQRKNEAVVLVPPQQVIGSLQGIVVMPSQVAPGEPMQMRVTDMSALPAGGSWSLSGVVLDDPKASGLTIEEEEVSGLATGSDSADGSTRRVALGVPSGEEVSREALEDIAAILAMSTDGQGPWEVVALDAEASPGSTGITIEEEEVYRVRPTGSGSDEAESRIVTIARGGEGGRGTKVVMFGEKKGDKKSWRERRRERRAQRRFDRLWGDFCFERLPSSGKGFVIVEVPDPEFCPEFGIRGGGGQGDHGVVTYELQIAMVPSESATTLFAISHNSIQSNNKTAKTRIVAGANLDGTVDFLLPEDLAPGGELSLQYVDLYGDVVVDVPSVPGVEILDPSADAGAARIIDATPRTFAGQQACVCGLFPGPEAWNALLLDGAALGSPVSASSRMAWVQLPASLTPGAHVVSGALEPGFPAEDQATVLVLQIGGEVDSSKLQRLETTPMRLWVDGTSEPVEIRVRNKTPSIISIEGGPDQTILTSGGEPNMLERSVQGLSPGAFDIAYELAGAGCPCASAETHYW